MVMVVCTVVERLDSGECTEYIYIFRTTLLSRYIYISLSFSLSFSLALGVCVFCVSLSLSLKQGRKKKEGRNCS